MVIQEVHLAYKSGIIQAFSQLEEIFASTDMWGVVMLHRWAQSGVTECLSMRTGQLQPPDLQRLTLTYHLVMLYLVQVMHLT